MILGEVFNILNEISPFELQEEWDNSGLILGAMSDEVKNIAIALDIDEEILDNIAENTLIITHHPLIFKKLNRLDYDLYPAKYIKKMIQKNISHIAVHTSFDKTHLNMFVAQSILKLKNITQKDFVCFGEIKEQTLEEFVEYVKKELGLLQIKYTKANKTVKRVALTTGSGASMLEYIDADCFLTGDVKYHDAMLSNALGISVVDITHYASERFFSTILCEKLKHNGIKAIIADSKDPFIIMQEKK
ncbi:MAG: cyclohydrolase [Campylobacterota bacterium]|nr:cyclohydrolase [Campylobacterota bacterium]